MGDPLRIVSLISSGTEIVCALGLEECLVGRSHECDYPEWVARLPAVSASRVDASVSSRAIHEQVTAAYGKRGGTADALSIYQVDAGLLAELKPDVIVTQSQCEVCAVSLGQVEEAVCGIVGSRPRIVSLEPHGLEDVWRDVERVGEAMGARPRAAELVGALRERLDEVAREARRFEPTSVVCVEWIEPLMAAGNWVPELVEIARGRDLVGSPGVHSPWMEWDRFHEADPDAIVLMPCGLGLEKTCEEARRLWKHPGFRNYRAVKAGRVYAVDGNSFFNRPGPRLVESAEILAEVFHGGAMRFGHEGKGWRRLS